MYPFFTSNPLGEQGWEHIKEMIEREESDDVFSTSADRRANTNRAIEREARDLAIKQSWALIITTGLFVAAFYYIAEHLRLFIDPWGIVGWILFGGVAVFGAWLEKTVTASRVKHALKIAEDYRSEFTTRSAR